jgi:NAD(P)-dependent dehydrogenase (short-subunit alcohol dehydrogenase family)
MRLQGKTAIITGAGSGIGEASAKLFAAEGARVAIVDFDEAGGNRVAKEIGNASFFLRADVSKPADMEKMTQTTVEQWGRIDILFNNAGVSSVGAVHETTEPDWDRVMAINAKGVYLACKYVVPVMLQQKAGCIINMASAAAVTGLAQRVAYSASKGAVFALTRAMQADYCRQGIRVNSLVPGTIYTPFVEGYLKKHHADDMEKAKKNIGKRQLSGTLGTPEDIAYAALYLASDEARFVLGSGMVVDGGLLAGKIFD